MLDGHKLKDEGFEEEKNNRLQIPRKTQGPAGIPRIPKKGLGNDPIENFKI
jgi:hypothetical protein